MTIQSSGTISLSTLAGEYGGSTPHSLSEYYRSGGLVPSTISSSSVAYGSWSGYSFSALTIGGGAYDPANVDTGCVLTYTSGILSGGAWYSQGVYAGSSTGTILSILDVLGDGFQFQRGSVVSSATSGTKEYLFYNIRGRSVDTTITSTSVNTNVPTSGAIDLNDFYNGRKT